MEIQEISVGHIDYNFVIVPANGIVAQTEQNRHFTHVAVVTQANGPSGYTAAFALAAHAVPGARILAAEVIRCMQLGQPLPESAERVFFV